MKFVHGSEVFNCDICDFKAKSKRSLTVHNGLYHKEKTFNCKYCDFKAGYQHRINKHVRMKHGKQMTEKERIEMKIDQCSICKFTSNFYKVKEHIEKNVDPLTEEFFSYDKGKTAMLVDQPAGP